MRANQKSFFQPIGISVYVAFIFQSLHEIYSVVVYSAIFHKDFSAYDKINHAMVLCPQHVLRCQIIYNIWQYIVYYRKKLLMIWNICHSDEIRQGRSRSGESIHSVESPSMVDPQWDIWYWGSKWNLHSLLKCGWLWVGHNLCLLWDYLCLLCP